MPVGNRFFRQPPPSNVRSITLPDSQQFISQKLINISQAAAVLTINLETLAAPLTYTASSEIAASFVFQSIIDAVTSSTNASVTIVEPAPIITSVTISSTTPGTVGNLAAAGYEPVVVAGTGFLTLIAPLYVIVIYPGGGAGPTYNYFTDIVVVDDVTIHCNSVPLAVGTWPLLVAGPEWAANIDVNVV